MILSQVGSDGTILLFVHMEQNNTDGVQFLGMAFFTAWTSCRQDVISCRRLRFRPPLSQVVF